MTLVIALLFCLAVSNLSTIAVAFYFYKRAELHSIDTIEYIQELVETLLGGGK